jgi:hypothetical protein
MSVSQEISKAMLKINKAIREATGAYATCYKGKNPIWQKKYTQKHEEFNDNKHKEGQNRGLKSF